VTVVVIGAGLVGTLVAREFCRRDCRVVLVERGPDVGLGVSKANSGIIHAGYDDEPGTLRSRFCVPGNALWSVLADELDIDVQRIGSHVVAFRREDLNLLDELLARGQANGVAGLRILDQAELLQKEPHLNPAAVASLWAPSAAVTEPWQLVIAATENALANGLELRLGEEVTGFETTGGALTAVLTTKGRIGCDAAVNAAGLWADRVANLAGDPAPPLTPRRGEYILLNKFTAHDLVNSVLFPVPSSLGKGLLVTPTVDKGILLGPTAENLPRALKDDRATTAAGLEKIVASARHMVPSLDLREAVKVFAGSRPESPGKDFWIEASPRWKGLVHAGALRSPGLTAAPALAPYLVELVEKSLGRGLPPKAGFDPRRRRIPSYLKDLSLEALEAAIAEDPAAGRVVCVCNKVTEKEVVEAVRRGARSLDGVKFRTRALFGECQGGFCSHRILHLVARELGVGEDELDYGLDGSWVVKGKVRP
jgi:glycerol-3-phosphate dehydrogenase